MWRRAAWAAILVSIVLASFGEGAIGSVAEMSFARKTHLKCQPPGQPENVEIINSSREKHQYLSCIKIGKLFLRKAINIGTSNFEKLSGGDVTNSICPIGSRKYRRRSGSAVFEPKNPHQGNVFGRGLTFVVDVQSDRVPQWRRANSEIGIGDRQIGSQFLLGRILGISNEIAGRSSKKPRCDAKYHRENCNDTITTFLDESSQTKAVADKRAIENADVFLKGMFAIALVLLVNAIMKRWGGPRDPRDGKHQ